VSVWLVFFGWQDFGFDKLSDEGILAVKQTKVLLAVFLQAAINSVLDEDLNSNGLLLHKQFPYIRIILQIILHCFEFSVFN